MGFVQTLQHTAENALMVGQALNAAVAVGSSQTVGHYRGVVALVETLIIAVLTILILQWLAITVDTPTLIFSGVVVLTIVIPTVLLLVLCDRFAP